jgi:hypothetical protein
MSQHDFIIDNQLFPQTRADINAALQAIATNSSGATEPAIPTTDPVTDRGHQWWYDTTNYQLKIRNTAGTGWTVIATLDAAGDNVVSITTQGLTLGATAILASADEINTLNDLTRGSLIYGNASGATARLAAGGVDTVLTSDGTDISWAAAAGGGGVPAGTVIYHAANTAPTDFIKANGAAVSRTTYSDLFTAIGTTFGVGDGSSTFNVPDLRGEFMRGWDDSRGIDTSRAFGSAQVDTFKEHKHLSFVRYQSNYAPFPYGNAASNGWDQEMSPNGAEGNEVTPYNSPVGDDETRPRNIALLACIKY